MANPYNEGYKPVLDHLDVKNRESITAWEERLWQRQQRSEFIDPRDEHGRQFFRKHTCDAQRVETNGEKPPAA